LRQVFGGLRDHALQSGIAKRSQIIFDNNPAIA
jgi:hypothetical protein